MKKFSDEITIWTEEDITDFLLELVDSGFIKFDSCGFATRKTILNAGRYPNGDTYWFCYMIKNILELSNSEELNLYTTNLNKIDSISNRWKLQFKISLADNLLFIYDKLPSEILKLNKYLHTGNDQYGSLLINDKITNARINLEKEGKFTFTILDPGHKLTHKTSLTNSNEIKIINGIEELIASLIKKETGINLGKATSIKMGGMTSISFDILI